MARRKTDLRERFGRLLQAGFAVGESRKRITWELLARKHWELLHSEDVNVVQRELHWLEERVFGLSRSVKVSELPVDDRTRLEQHLRDLAKRARLDMEGTDGSLEPPAGSA